MSRYIDSTPAQDGFWMPGEHEAHDEIWMIWPECTSTWVWGAKPAQAIFARVAKTIAQKTPVTIAVSALQYENARQQLPPHIRVIEMSSNDAWMRNIGPSYVINKDGERRGVDWIFNAWDRAYRPYHDDFVARKVCGLLQDDCYRAPLILEGGAIHVDGEGTLFTTEEYLLHSNRNPGMTRSDIENHLKDYLGVQKIIWLPFGIHSDDDNGSYVDLMLHVVRPGEVVISWPDDTTSPQYKRCKQAWDTLKSTADAKGRRLTVHKLPCPDPIYISAHDAEGFDSYDGWGYEAGQQIAASYTNFLLSNSSVIYPTFNQPKKDEAAGLILENLYPGKKVVGIPSQGIALSGAGIHSITQQIPSKR